MERYAVNKKRYAEVYVKTGQTEGLIEYMEKVVLADGHMLWEVCASYAKALKPTTYYVAAKTQIQARKIFENKYPWLNHISSVGLPSSETADFVLNNPLKRFVI